MPLESPILGVLFPTTRIEGKQKKGIAICDTPVFSFPFCYSRQPCPKKSDNLLTASILVGIITSA